MSDRDDARRLLRELLPELLNEALANGNGQRPHDGPPGAATPVPAPPVAAVMRPSTWDRPPAPGEVIGDGARAAAPGVESVTLESDEDLDRFVRSLAARFEDPRARKAVQEGRLRFALRRAHSGGPAAGTVRIERGAVTERTVKDAAAAGSRLVLAPRAVLTPLAREKARALGIEIERERRC
jgi:hypothetical protein